MRLHALAAVVVAVTAVDAAAQYCPSNPPPDERDKRPKTRDQDNTCNRSTMGDPVVVTGNNAYTFDRLEDFFIPTAQGGLSVYRTYYSSHDPWMQLGGSEKEVQNIPTPFGKSPNDTRSLRWTHNLFSFVDNRWNPITVRPPAGTYERFGADCGTPGCWVPRNNDSPGQPARLRRTANGFEYFQDDGKRYLFEAPATGNLLYFLSAIVAPSGDTIATIEYAPPNGLSCAPLLPPAGVPYISAVQVAGGPRLEFGYVKLTRAGSSDQECVLAGISADDGSSTVPLTSYTYVESGGSPRPGKLASAQTPQYLEEFDYSAGFKVKQNAVVVVDHVGETVTSAGDFLGNYSFGTLQPVGNNCATQWKTGYCCSESVARSRTVTTTSAGIGDGTGGGTLFTQTFKYVSGEWATRHTAQPVSRVEACASAPDSCSSGETVYMWDSADTNGKAPGNTGVNCGPGYPGYVSGTKNKRRNWTMTPNRVSTTLGIATLEQTYELRGIASGSAGGGGSFNCSPECPVLTGAGGGGGGAWENLALEWTKYEYQYPNATQRVSKEIQPSAISGTRETEYRFDAQGRVIATVTTGKTRDVAGVESTKFRATFVSYDTNGRPTRREGPCFLVSQQDTACTGPRPVVDYTYFGANNGFSTGRLWTTTRYPVACVPGSCTGGLTTTFSNYTPLGEPGSVTDENGVTTTYTYVGSQVASRTVGSITWTYTWDTEKLTSVRNPQGDYEVFSYRDGAGAWVGRLMWKAKAGNATGTEWSEKVEYEYWPDGTVKWERARCNTAPPVSCPDNGTGGVRWERKYAADAERRQTWSKSTGFASNEADVKGYDGANNVTRIGRAYNTPPAFCGTPGSPSDVCALLTFDRAERLAQVDEKPAAGATTATTCLDYDKQGNVTRVIQGCTSGASCSKAGGTSSCANAPVSQYQHDDFGNIIEVRLPNTDDGTGMTYGVVRSEFDAQGNVIKRQDETQRANPNGVVQLYGYDALGRLRGGSQTWMGSAWTQYSIYYDNDASAPTIPGSCPQPSLTLGRVKLRQDPLWTTWYQYDAEGRVLKEVRVRTPASGPLPACTTNPDANPHTTYAYTDNGNVSSITYPHGRSIQYAYGSGYGQNNRVTSISAAKWTGSAWTAPQVLLSNVYWEPYGGLRGYQMSAWKTSQWLTTEYLLGNAVQVPTGCTTTQESPVDKSGRLRSVWVSLGQQGLGSGAGNVFNRTYSWVADQVARMDTCYLGNNSTPQVDDYRNLGDWRVGYDRLLRLKTADNPAIYTGSGLYLRRQYGYSPRGNIESITTDQYNDVWELQYDTNVHKVDQLSWMKVNRPTSRLRNDWSYDRDGRVSQKRWPAYDDGTAGPYVNFGYLSQFLASGPGGDSTIRSVTTSAGATYTYYYDVENKRVQKAYPTGVVDEYFYDLSKNLLEDRGNVSTAGGQGYSLDEYVWLDGRPVAVFRSGFNSSWVRQQDVTGTCTRNGEVADCDVYFPVTDHIGKPVVTVNSQRQVSGVGEYDPYGMLNRANYWGDTVHPYANNTPVTTLADWDYKLLGMTLDVRAHFNQFDLDGCGGDWVALKDGASGTVIASLMREAKLGDVWSDWGSTASGRVKVDFASNDRNCRPNQYCKCKVGTSWAFSGAALKEIELRRHQATNWYFPPLRFPGQYFDAETDLHENWNRFYDPQTGRYLQSEPLLATPGYAFMRAYVGLSVAYYAYASSNPLWAADLDGLAEGWEKNAAKFCRGMVPSECQACCVEAIRRDRTCRAANPGVEQMVAKCMPGFENDMQMCSSRCKPVKPGKAQPKNCPSDKPCSPDSPPDHRPPGHPKKPSPSIPAESAQ